MKKASPTSPKASRSWALARCDLPSRVDPATTSTSSPPQGAESWEAPGTPATTWDSHGCQLRDASGTRGCWEVGWVPVLPSWWCVGPVPSSAGPPGKAGPGAPLHMAPVGAGDQHSGQGACAENKVCVAPCTLFQSVCRGHSPRASRPCFCCPGNGFEFQGGPTSLSSLPRGGLRGAAGKRRSRVGLGIQWQGK